MGLSLAQQQARLQAEAQLLLQANDMAFGNGSLSSPSSSSSSSSSSGSSSSSSSSSGLGGVQGGLK